MNQSKQACSLQTLEIFLLLAMACFIQPVSARPQNVADTDERGATRLMRSLQPTHSKPAAQPPPMDHKVATRPSSNGEPRVIDAGVIPSDAGQGRGNSGVFLQRRYEIQVLDSYNNKTYYDGQAGSVYKQYAPLVNASRKPGEWQTYDIVYHAPRFEADGKLAQPATVTVFQNGVLVQDHVTIKGPTMTDKPGFIAHNLKEPIELQDHGNPVRYRNIWIREL